MSNEAPDSTPKALKGRVWWVVSGPDAVPDDEAGKSTVFIARSYLIHRFQRSYSDEGVFSTYENALAFLQTLEGEEEDNCTRFEILATTLDSRTPGYSMKSWDFDRMLNLLDSTDAPFRPYTVDFDEEGNEYHDYGESCELEEGKPGKFSVGDIVLLKELPRTDFTKGVADRIAVVGTAPGPRMEFQGTIYYEIPAPLPEGAELFWDKTYTVYFITERGYIDHEHPMEDELEAFTDPLPEEEQFLHTLSDHFTGRRRIREDLLNDLFDFKIFVKKVRHFTEDDLEPSNDQD